MSGRGRLMTQSRVRRRGHTPGWPLLPFRGNSPQPRPTKCHNPLGTGGHMGPPLQKVLDLPPHPPQCAHWGTFPPRGRLSGRTMCAPTAETETDASPVAFCLLFRHGKRRSPPAGGETPLRKARSGAPSRRALQSVNRPLKCGEIPCNQNQKGRTSCENPKKFSHQ